MKLLQRYNNEKGFALILALSMLAIMSILGAFALMTSTTEVQISGNYSVGQQAFSAAERTMEVGAELIRTEVGAELIRESENERIDLDTADLDNFRAFPINTEVNVGATLIEELRIGISGPVPDAGNAVQLLRFGPAPGYGTAMQGYYFAISAVGGAVFDANDIPRIRTRLESQKMYVRPTAGTDPTKHWFQ